MLDKVILIGNVGKEPEGSSGKVNYTKFSLATNDNVKNANGEWENRAKWHNVITFDKTADYVKNYVKKGDKLYIEGIIKYGEYTDKSGVVRKTFDIVGNVVKQLTAKEVNKTDNSIKYDDDVPF
jgi:single-strand DNA-binding protein